MNTYYEHIFDPKLWPNELELKIWWSTFWLGLQLIWSILIRIPCEHPKDEERILSPMQ